MTGFPYLSTVRYIADILFDRGKKYGQRFTLPRKLVMHDAAHATMCIHTDGLLTRVGVLTPTVLEVIDKCDYRSPSRFTANCAPVLTFSIRDLAETLAA